MSHKTANTSSSAAVGLSIIYSTIYFVSNIYDKFRNYKLYYDNYRIKIIIENIHGKDF
ncbi:hypothetical protein CQA01_21350 [Cyclobacterium qasimii]|uniref:Uncharacterized protein n=1 Tax=Cyclobacterium qasimii TaxID=1350429 RepID=A0A512CBL8_9BACT|nr:hypothetical protein CQA01_21350 [Cyclobacterium qasimii]